MQHKKDLTITPFIYIFFFLLCLIKTRCLFLTKFLKLRWLCHLTTLTAAKRNLPPYLHQHLTSAATVFLMTARPLDGKLPATHSWTFQFFPSAAPGLGQIEFLRALAGQHSPPEEGVCGQDERAGSSAQSAGVLCRATRRPPARENRPRDDCEQGAILSRLPAAVA